MASPAATHLCVLVHGLWGNPTHLWYLVESLNAQFPDLHVFVPKRNAGNFTYDGIEVGGERVTQEIEEELESLERKGVHIKKISVIGYSLGGLVARYAIGLLYHKGWFDKVEPVNLTTFATPHLGVRTPLRGYHNHLWNVLGARTLSISGRQLFIIDSFRDTRRPLLAVLADPDSIFIRALASFKHRSLYSNIVNDRSAVFYTTAISRVDPFVNLSAVNINYLPKYAPIIVDSESPVSPKDEDALPSFNKRYLPDTHNLFARLRFAVFLTFLLPIGTTVFLANAAIQSVMSRQRIRAHIEGRAGVAPKAYQIPLFAENVQRTAEDLYENLGGHQEQEYLPEGSEEIAQPDSPLLSSKRVNEKRAAGKPSPDVDSPTKQRQQDFPTLALSPAQFAMVQALDDVGWKKYPVHIHNVNHSHAAIIVRMNRANFSEGKLVVQHWLSEFEV